VVARVGSIENVEVVRGIDKSLDTEAIRVIKSMPDWKPGRMNGRTVKVKYTLPIYFRLM
jgi:protein TonB